MKGVANWLILLSLFILISISGCKEPEPEPPTHVNITNNLTNNELKFILLDSEGKIPLEQCSERALNDKIIFMESEYCGACKVARPRLEEIEQELQTDFIWLDLSKKEDVERLREFKIIPQYTPTALIGCEILIGSKSKDEYKQVIEEFLK